MEELRQTIIAAINESRLPAEGVYYIIKDVYRDVESSYFEFLKNKKENAEEGEE